jgi:hypothetical protein
MSSRLNLLEFFTSITFIEQHSVWSSSLCNHFHSSAATVATHIQSVLQSPVHQLQTPVIHFHPLKRGTKLQTTSNQNAVSRTFYFKGLYSRPFEALWLLFVPPGGVTPRKTNKFYVVPTQSICGFVRVSGNKFSCPTQY